MRRFAPTTLAAALALLTGAAQALAPVSPADLVGSGLLSATCSTLHGNGDGQAITGTIGSGFFADGSQCTGQLVNGGAGTAASTSAFSNAQAATSASGKATLGTLRLASQLDTPGSSSVAVFPASISQVAFADTLTVNLAGHQGQNGFLLVKVQVAGTLDASGNAGSAGLSVAATKNHFTLEAGNPGYDNGTGKATSTDRQIPAWAVASYPPPGPLQDHLAISELVTFSIPVVFGTSFEMGLVAMSIAGIRSSDGGGHAVSDFGHTISWAGVAGVLQGGQSQAGYTLTSLSGTDWTQAAAVPEPATWLSLSGGLALLGLTGLRRRRAQRGSGV